MNRLKKPPNQCKRHAHRRGAVFGYVMAYLSLSLLLLGLMGTMLHLVLRTTETDQRLFRDLARLRSTEKALRNDAARADEVDVAERKVTFVSNETVSIWTVDEHQLRQEVLRAGERAEQAVIRFRPGTSLAFSVAADQLMALQISSPPVTVNRSASQPLSGSRVVEILLPLPAPSQLSGGVNAVSEKPSVTLTVEAD